MKYNRSLEKQFTASALIKNDENKVLLVYHKKLDVWLYPGGHIESNETPDEAVIREVKEETGIDIEIIGNKNTSLADSSVDVSVLYNPYIILCERIQGANEHYHIDMIYSCRVIKDSELKFDKNESTGIGYFSKQDIESMSLFQNFRDLLNQYFIENI